MSNQNTNNSMSILDEKCYHQSVVQYDEFEDPTTGVYSNGGVTGFIAESKDVCPKCGYEVDEVYNK